MSNKNERNVADELYLKNKEMMYFMLGSCISSSTLRTVEDCEDSIRTINMLKFDIERSNVIDEKTKKEWLDFCNEGFNIVNRDKLEMEENGGVRSSC